MGASRKWSALLSKASVGVLLCFFSLCVSSGIEIEGVGNETRANILAHMVLDDQPCDAEPHIVRQRYRAAPDNIRSAMAAIGFYQVVIESTLKFEQSCWSAQFHIAPGEPVRLREVELRLTGEAQQDPEFKPLAEQLNKKIGTRLRHSEYDSFKQQVADKATSRGYFDGAFESSRLDIYPDNLAADIHIHYASGPRFQFGQAKFEQQVFSEFLLQRFIRFSVGDAWNSNDITDLYKSLIDSDYFSSVQIVPMPEDAQGLQVPIAIKLTPRARKSYSAGLGFSTDTGPNIRLGYKDRRFNEHGHRLQADIAASKVKSSAGLAYRVPRRDPRKEWLDIYGGAETEDTDSFNSTAAKVGVRSTRMRRGSWLETRFVEAVWETFDIGLESSSSRLLIPGISWAKTSEGNVSRPRRGYRLSLEVKGTTEQLGSDTAFLQAYTRGKLILPMPANARLITRTEFGVTIKDDLQDLPPSVRFFAGGDNSVRGYDFESLGPVNNLGQVIGGSHKLVASVEYDFPIAENWSIASFVDAGNAFNTKDFDINRSVGLGVRWYSPIGPFRIDLAHPLDDDEQVVRLHISLGADL